MYYNITREAKENAAKRKASWKALEHLYSLGKCKAIGVSNYTVTHLQELLSYATVIPAVNQVEFHPHLQQGPLLQFCKQHNIQLEAYSPLGSNEGMVRSVLFAMLSLFSSQIEFGLKKGTHCKQTL